MQLKTDYTLKTIGDEHIQICFVGQHASLETRLALQTLLLDSNKFLEVVTGVADIVIRYDAIEYSNEEAQNLLSTLLSKDVAGGVSVPSIEIPVCYDGEFGIDLDFLTSALNLSISEIIDLHTARKYIIEAIGFLPGFAYCGPLAERLQTPRRDTPRKLLAAGSIAIANRQTGIYSLPSPGGWHVIGRTPLQLFDPNKNNPFVLQAGQQVRFVAISRGEFDSFIAEAGER